MGLTCAECKCLREGMGLTTKWLADRWHVAEYSVKRWETSRVLPADLEADLLGLRSRFDHEVEAAASTPADGSILVPRTDAQTSGAYPAAWHRAIAQQAARRAGCRVLYTDDEQL